MNTALVSRVRTGGTILLLLVALVAAVLLTCGCVPTTSGEASALKSIYAVRLRLPGQDSRDVRVGSFGLCAQTTDSIRCAKTGGKNAAHDVVPVLYGSEASGADNKAVEIALALQHEVWYGTSILGAFFIFCSAVCAVVGLLLASPCPRRMKMIAAGLAGLGAAVMLVDGFSTHLVHAALDAASKTVQQGSGYTYEAGVYWAAMQWLAFGASAVATVLLWLDSRKSTRSAAPAA
jgi:lysylphosphatidylglycerol synthetase-like protein (DUF2156 family)